MTASLDWPYFAACRDVDPDLFFPVAEPGTPAYDEQAAEAKAVCAGCDVRRHCLSFAASTRQKAGIWGGLTEAELHLEVRRRQRRVRDRMVA